jgi:hypothetical protein
MIRYSRTPEFEKDFKQLLKSYRSLEEDFADMKDVLLKLYFERDGKVANDTLVRMQVAVAMN